MQQELLSTFAEELGSVTLIPDDTGGVFEVKIDGKLIWSRGEHDARFPEMGGAEAAGARRGGAGARPRPCRGEGVSGLSLGVFSRSAPLCEGSDKDIATA